MERRFSPPVNGALLPPTNGALLPPPPPPIFHGNRNSPPLPMPMNGRRLSPPRRFSPSRIDGHFSHSSHMHPHTMLLPQNY